MVFVVTTLCFNHDIGQNSTLSKLYPGQVLLETYLTLNNLGGLNPTKHILYRDCVQIGVTGVISMAGGEVLDIEGTSLRPC